MAVYILHTYENTLHIHTSSPGSCGCQLINQQSRPPLLAELLSTDCFSFVSCPPVVLCRIVRVVSFLIFCWGTASDGRDSRRGSSARSELPASRDFQRDRCVLGVIIVRFGERGPFCLARQREIPATIENGGPGLLLSLSFPLGHVGAPREHPGDDSAFPSSFGAATAVKQDKIASLNAMPCHALPTLYICRRQPPPVPRRLIPNHGRTGSSAVDCHFRSTS